MPYRLIPRLFPAQIGKLRNIKKLNLANNKFEGPIPTEIAHLGTALGSDGFTYLDLSHNNFTGIIPSEIGYLESLECAALPQCAELAPVLAAVGASLCPVPTLYLPEILLCRSAGTWSLGSQHHKLPSTQS